MLPIASLLVSPALGGHARTQSPAGVLFPADVVHVDGDERSGSAGWSMLLAAVPAAAGCSRRPSAGALVARDGLALLGDRARRGRPRSWCRAWCRRCSRCGTSRRSSRRATGARCWPRRCSLGVPRRPRRGQPPAARPGARLRRRRRRRARSGSGRSLRRNVRVEVALIAVALAVTALLVAFAPPSRPGQRRPRRTPGPGVGPDHDRRHDAPLHGRPRAHRAEPAQPLPLRRTRPAVPRHEDDPRRAEPAGRPALRSSGCRWRRSAPATTSTRPPRSTGAAAGTSKLTTTGTSSRPYDVAEIQLAIG